MGVYMKIRKNILFIILFIVLLAISLSAVSAGDTGKTKIEVNSVEHSNLEKEAELHIKGEVSKEYQYSYYGYSYYNPLENANVTLNINNKNYTQVSDYYGGFDFYVPLKSGTYNYKITYPGNSYTYSASSTEGSYTIPKTETYFNYVNTGLATNKLVVTAQLYGYDDYNYNYEIPVYGKQININVNGKLYSGTTNYDGVVKLYIPSTTGNKKILVSFAGDGIYGGASESKSISISSYSVVKTTTANKFVKYFEKGNYLYKRYKQTVKKYYFNGKTKTTSKFINKKISYLKVVKFGSGSSSKIVRDYGYDGYLVVDKYSYLKQIGVYDYIYDGRYLDYFKIVYKSGKTKKVSCSHYYSNYWIFSSKNVAKMKFYFYI